MKYLILFLFPISMSAQSFQELILEYEKDCNLIVLDTINQAGVVSYEHIPVKNEKGETMHFVLGKPDTVWEEASCPTYKFATYSNIIGDVIWNSSSTYVLAGEHALMSTEKEKRHKSSITRKYVCEVKKRKVEPFSNDFWNWIKNHK